MAIPVTCTCGKTLRVKDVYAGRRVKCPECGALLAIELPAEPSSPKIDVEIPDKDHRLSVLWVGLGIFCTIFIVIAVIVDSNIKANRAAVAAREKEDKLSVEKQSESGKSTEGGANKIAPQEQHKEQVDSSSKEEPIDKSHKDTLKKENEERIQFAKNLVPDVTNNLDLDIFLKNEPSARLMSDNDGYLEYISGNKISKINVGFVDRKMIGYEELILCNNLDDAEKRVKALQDNLGVPDIDFIPDTEKERKSIKFYMWDIKELGYSIKCSIMKGMMVDGMPTFYFEQGVTDLKTLKAKYKK